MKLTRERKIFGAVLALALGFLGYDQVCGGANADHSAQSDAGALLLVSAPGTSDKHNPVTGDAANEISLATRLSSLAEKTGVTSAVQIRDAFRPVAGWITKAAPTIVTISSADKFAAEHKLTAISTNAVGGSVAVVDGKLLHLGGAIDGFRLVAVDRQHATFRSSDGGRATLTLATSTAAAR